MVRFDIMEVGDTVLIYEGQQLGKQPTKRIIVAIIIKVYSWSYSGITSLEVQCKPTSRVFLANLKHGKVEVIKIK